MNVLCRRRTAARHRWLRYKAGGRTAANFRWHVRARWARKEHCKATAACKRCASARDTRARIRIGGHMQRERRSMVIMLEWGASMLMQEILVARVILTLSSRCLTQTKLAISLPWSATCTPPRHTSQTSSLVCHPPRISSARAKLPPIRGARGRHAVQTRLRLDRAKCAQRTHNLWK